MDRRLAFARGIAKTSLIIARTIKCSLVRVVLFVSAEDERTPADISWYTQARAQRLFDARPIKRSPPRFRERDSPRPGMPTPVRALCARASAISEVIAMHRQNRIKNLPCLIKRVVSRQNVYTCFFVRFVFCFVFFLRDGMNLNLYAVLNESEGL